MARNKWVHNQSWACFIVVHELHRVSRGSCAHGSINVSSQSIMSFLRRMFRRFMSAVAVHMALIRWACFIVVDKFIYMRTVAVHMARIKSVRNQSWACLIPVHGRLRCAHGSSRDYFSWKIMSLIAHGSVQAVYFWREYLWRKYFWREYVWRKYFWREYVWRKYCWREFA